MDRVSKAWQYIKPVGPSVIFHTWNVYSVSALMIIGISALLSFALSYRCYADNDETPFGLRILFALLAAGWNVLYLMYYFVTVHIIGMKCGN